MNPKAFNWIDCFTTHCGHWIGLVTVDCRVLLRDEGVCADVDGINYCCASFRQIWVAEGLVNCGAAPIPDQCFWSIVTSTYGAFTFLSGYPTSTSVEDVGVDPPFTHTYYSLSSFTTFYIGTYTSTIDLGRNTFQPYDPSISSIWFTPTSTQTT